MSPRLLILALVAASACLAGCGKTADLDRPQPMFGHPNDEIPVTKNREQAAARARADAASAGVVEHGPQSIEELRQFTQPAKPKRQPGPSDGDPATEPSMPPKPPR